MPTSNKSKSKSTYVVYVKYKGVDEPVELLLKDFEYKNLKKNLNNPLIELLDAYKFEPVNLEQTGGNFYQLNCKLQNRVIWEDRNCFCDDSGYIECLSDDSNSSDLGIWE